jgi:oxygen-independent coproporphyrinogen-3 oxidase
MGRAHGAGDAVRAFHDLRAAGFDNISVDLMAAWPGQSLVSVEENLRRALELEPEHLSVYLLEVKEGTRLARRIEAGEVEPPDDDLAAEMYERFCALAEAAGCEQYEISNFARPGRRCRHNLKYWSDEVFLAAGAGAHGMTGRVRYENRELLTDYQARVLAGLLPRSVVTELTPQARFKDALIMGMRLVEGVDLEALAARYGVDARRYVLESAGDLVGAGLIRLEDSRCVLSPRGRLLSNQVFSRWV